MRNVDENEERTMSQAPTVGEIVHYRLSTADVADIERDIPQRDGNGQYLRNPIRKGQIYPAMVTATFGNGSTANLVVQLDGAGQYWATSRAEDDVEPHHWFRPPRS
jgi:hypothetical protein